MNYLQKIEGFDGYRLARHIGGDACFALGIRCIV